MARPKPHFKIHLSIDSHKNTAVMWGNVIDRGIYCELGRLSVQKYASKTGNQFHMSTAELMVVTGCATAGAAAVRWKSFLRHCTLGAKALGGYPPITSEALGRHWRVTIRNLAEKQGFVSGNEQECTPTEHRAQNEEQIALTTPSTYKWQRPESAPLLPVETVKNMIAVKPNGVTHTAENVQVWWQWVVPQMLDRGTLAENLGRARPNWWKRLRADDMATARAWISKSIVYEQAAEFDEVANGDPSKPQFTEDEIEEAANALS